MACDRRVSGCVVCGSVVWWGGGGVAHLGKVTACRCESLLPAPIGVGRGVRVRVRVIGLGFS